MNVDNNTLKNNPCSTAMVQIKHMEAHMGYYIAGFVDGEGSFNTSFRRRDDFRLGWKITPVFNVSQKERTVLDLIAVTLKCGTIRFRKHGVWVYQVTDRKHLRDIVLPFFDRFVLHSEWKKRDLEIFRVTCFALSAEKTLSMDTIRKVCALVDSKPPASSRKYTTVHIMERCLEFSEKKQP